MIQEKVAIPKSMMAAPTTSKDLFSFLAKQIELFLREHHTDKYEEHIKRRNTIDPATTRPYPSIHTYRLGFTFSFPVTQEGINKGVLMRWTKGYDIKDTVGQDVCKLLQDEIDALNLPVKVVALVNDTAGTLMARSYTSPGKTGTFLGGIFGTGTNGAYVESLPRIPKMEKSAADFDKSTGLMVINSEWGSFDNKMSVLPDTPYDQKLDAISPNPGIQMFEKRVSGMFLGEILRQALLGLLNRPECSLFSDENSSANDLHSTTRISKNAPIHKEWGIDSSFLSLAANDDSIELATIRMHIEKDLGIDAASLEDARAVKIIADAIGRRSARLAAVAIAGVVVSTGQLGVHPSIPVSSATIAGQVQDLKLGTAAASAATTIIASASSLISGPAAIDSASPNPENPSEATDIVDIGLDGSLVEFYPGFQKYLREALRSVKGVGPEGEKRIRIGIAKDGSGVGAALIAAVAATAAGDQEKQAERRRTGSEVNRMERERMRRTLTDSQMKETVYDD
jgi:hexokinase